MALAFGFMSLAHGPLMAFAAPASDSAPHAHHGPADPAHHDGAAAPAAAHDHSGHSHAAAHDGHALPAAPDASAACNSFDCCTAVAPPAIAAPALGASPLETLAALPPRRISPAGLEPADPPPRLQA